MKSFFSPSIQTLSKHACAMLLGTLFMTVQLPVAQARGTGDSGGGNGVEGRPLEAYTVDVTSTPEWQDHVAPIERHLRSIPSSTTDIAFGLESAAKGPTWYMVPVPLAKLPRKVVGAGVGSQHLQQLALNFDTEIWLDQKLYEASAPKDRATLLIHEAVMSFYRLKFFSQYEMCLRYQSRTFCDQYKRMYDQLDGTATVVKRKMTGKDHENVRALTNYLVTKGTTTTELELWAMFDRYEFDRRFMPSAYRKSQGELVNETWEIDRLHGLIQELRASGNLPVLCGPAGPKVKGRCELHSEIVKVPYSLEAPTLVNKLKLTLMERDSRGKVTRVVETYANGGGYYTWNERTASGKIKTIIAFGGLQEWDITNAGDIVYDVMFVIGGQPSMNQRTIEQITFRPYKVVSRDAEVVHEGKKCKETKIIEMNANVLPTMILSSEPDVLMYVRRDSPLAQTYRKCN